MRFSIRSLLAIMLLCGILFPTLIGLRQIDRDEALRAQLLSDIQTERRKLALDDPRRALIKDRQRDEFASLHRLRERAEEHFATIRNTYGSIEFRGPEVLSLRSIPELSVDDQPTPITYGLLVPSERPVWLKYALVSGEGGSQLSTDLDQIDKAPPDSGYDHPGPYEIALEPGERALSIRTEEADGNVLPLTIELDGRPLLQTRFSGDAVPSASAYHLSGRRQIDYAPQRPLPWLLDQRIRWEHADGTQANAGSIPSLWLSDRSSDYVAFPQPVGKP